jgi:hypothetical protein
MRRNIAFESSGDLAFLALENDEIIEERKYVGNGTGRD